MENIKYLLYPKSIAILGASTDFNKFSGRPLRFLLKHGYAGKLYPVNPKPETTEILGIPCYNSLTEIDAAIDQVIIALPARLVLESLRACVRLNVKSAVLFSSGFAEAGAEGKRLQAQVAEIARTSNMALCGPNCQGLINLKDNVISSFSNVLERDRLIDGNVGFISQSGALAGSILSLAQKHSIGLSHWISVGNEAVLDVADFIEYLARDAATRVIAAYVEGIKNVDKWIQAGQSARKARKPIVVMKTGQSSIGGAAIVSHTGSVAGEDFIADAFFNQLGMLRVNDIDDMLDSLQVLSTEKMPGKGRVGILTSSGGAGIILADACAAAGIPLAVLTDATRVNLKAKLPEFASVLNPVDVTAQLFQMIFTRDADLFQKCLQDMLSDDTVDILVIALTMLIGDRGVKIARDIVALAGQTGKPIAVVWLAGDMAQDGYRILKEHHIPLYSSATRCVAAIRQAKRYHHQMTTSCRCAEIEKKGPQTETRPEVITKTKVLLGSSSRHIAGYAGRNVLALYDIAIPKGGLAQTETEAIAIGRTFNYPLALKIDSPDILHKTDARCVLLNIEDETDLIEGFGRILANAGHFHPKASINGVLIEEMIDGREGFEVIAGMQNDPIFGPTIVLGSGGIFVEVFKDVACRVAPLTRRDVSEMIRQVKIYPILKGVRGRPALSIGALEKVLLNLNRLAMDFRHAIASIDINPLIVLAQGKGVLAADALIIKK